MFSTIPWKQPAPAVIIQSHHFEKVLTNYNQLDGTKRTAYDCKLLKNKDNGVS